MELNINTKQVEGLKMKTHLHIQEELDFKDLESLGPLQEVKDKMINIPEFEYEITSYTGCPIASHAYTAGICIKVVCELSLKI
jgi:hypothetical protein